MLRFVVFAANIVLISCFMQSAPIRHHSSHQHVSMMADRKPIIAGNWKLNTDLQSATKLAQDIGVATKKVSGVEIVVFPPFPFIRDVKANAGDHIEVGAQHCLYTDSGAFTSGVSVDMIKSIGCKVTDTFFHIRLMAISPPLTLHLKTISSHDYDYLMIIIIISSQQTPTNIQITPILTPNP
jgi:hypothetical protein